MSSLLRLLLPSRQPVWLVLAHQDDETSMAPLAVEMVAAGRRVNALMCTRGEASSVRTGAALYDRLGYTPTVEQFSAARDREFVAFCSELGITPVVPAWSDRTGDGALTPAHVRGLILAHAPPRRRVVVDGPFRLPPGPRRHL